MKYTRTDENALASLRIKCGMYLKLCIDTILMRFDQILFIIPLRGLDR